MVELDKSRITIYENAISMVLTQGETLRFRDDQLVQIQVRARFEIGTAISSQTIKVRVDDVLKEGIV